MIRSMLDADTVTRSTIPGRIRAVQLKGPRPGRPDTPSPVMSTESPSGQARALPNGWRDRVKNMLMSGNSASRIRKRRKMVAAAWRYVNVLR